MGKRINKQALVDEVMFHDIFEEASKSQITQFVDFFFDKIFDKVVEGNVVAISGLGKLERYERTKDGKPSGEYKIKFTAFNDLKERIRA